MQCWARTRREIGTIWGLYIQERAHLHVLTLYFMHHTFEGDRASLTSGSLKLKARVWRPLQEHTVQFHLYVQLPFKKWQFAHFLLSMLLPRQGAQKLAICFRMDPQQQPCLVDALLRIRSSFICLCFSLCTTQLWQQITWFVKPASGTNLRWLLSPPVNQGPSPAAAFKARQQIKCSTNCLLQCWFSMAEKALQLTEQGLQLDGCFLVMLPQQP